MEGDIDKALKYTNAYYPHVLEDNPEIVFQLKCRKYVEMIRRCSELQNPIPASVNTTNFEKNSTINGHTDVFDEDMELDDENDDDDNEDENEDDNESFQMANTTNSDAPAEATEEEDDDDDDEHDITSIEPAKYDELLQEAMSYGQTLMREYRDEKREYRKTLEDIFSLIAYDDAKASVHGHLLETGGRVQVAEELNSAILGENPFFSRKFHGKYAKQGLVCGTDFLVCQQSPSADPPPPPSNASISRPKPWSATSAISVARQRSSMSGMSFCLRHDRPFFFFFFFFAAWLQHPHCLCS